MQSQDPKPYEADIVRKDTEEPDKLGHRNRTTKAARMQEVMTCMGTDAVLPRVPTDLADGASTHGLYVAGTLHQFVFAIER